MKWGRNISKKLLERHQQEWKKCLNPVSTRDPPPYTADCSAVELLRSRPDSQADILTISLQLWVRHTDATSGFSASLTGPPRSDPQTRAAKEDINWLKWGRDKYWKNWWSIISKNGRNASTWTRTEILQLTRLIALPLSYWGLSPTHEPEGILTILLQLRVHHTDATSGFSASPTEPHGLTPKLGQSKKI